jgi:ABC-type multidrug transport system ATPase subunit
MDPGARRMMWDAILRATEPRQQAGRTTTTASSHAMELPAALLLTTHYLEEADALCDRVAIMAGRCA